MPSPGTATREGHLVGGVRQSVHPFDCVVPAAHGIACLYDVRVENLADESAGARLVASVRARVRGGRAVHPDAAHYVNLHVGRNAAVAAQQLVARSLGDGDGIDSVAVQFG